MQNGFLFLICEQIAKWETDGFAVSHLLFYRHELLRCTHTNMYFSRYYYNQCFYRWISNIEGKVRGYICLAACLSVPRVCFPNYCYQLLIFYGYIINNYPPRDGLQVPNFNPGYLISLITNLSHVMISVSSQIQTPHILILPTTKTHHLALRLWSIFVYPGNVKN